MNPELVKATYTVKYDTKGKTKRMIVSRVPVIGCLTIGFGLFFLLAYSGSVNANGHTGLNLTGLLIICGLFLLAAKLILFKLIYSVGKEEITVTEWNLLRRNKVTKVRVNDLESIRFGTEKVYVGSGEFTPAMKLWAVLKDGTSVELTDQMYDEKTLNSIERFIMVRSGVWKID